LIVGVESLIKHKIGLLNLVVELNNASMVCKVMGVSRDTFYRYRELAEDVGVDVLFEKSRRTAELKNRVEEAVEQAVVVYVIEVPVHGQDKTRNELRKQGVARIYQQTYVDSYSKVADCKHYTTETPISAADLLPFYEAQQLPMLRILTDRGTEYCGKVEHNDCQLYLAIKDIDHTKKQGDVTANFRVLALNSAV
jgi:hypothetical protein